MNYYAQQLYDKKLKYQYIINNSISKEDFDFCNSNEDIIKLFNEQLRNIKNIENSQYCFNYALNNTWINNIEQGIGIVFDKYSLLNFRKIKKGDIVLFRDDFDYLHIAKISKKAKNINDTIIIGKFGSLGIYEHRLIDTPLSYGNYISFWRKKKRVNNLDS